MYMVVGLKSNVRLERQYKGRYVAVRTETLDLRDLQNPNQREISIVSLLI